MKKTGEMLKQAREEKKLSLHEIGLSLKISSKILQAIEAGDETQLPAKTFLRGFVKSYAAYLRMDVDAVMKSFQEEMGTTSPAPLLRPTKIDMPNAEDAVLDEDGNMVPAKPTPASEAAKQASYDALHQTKNTKSIIIMIIAVILVALILCTKRMINKYSKEAELPQTEVTEPLGTPPPAAAVVGGTSAPVETAPSAEPLKEGAVSAAPSSTPLMSTAATPVTTGASNATANVIATPVPKPMAAVTPAASPSPTASAAAKVEAPKAAPTPAPVIAKATPSPSPTASPSPSPSASPVAAAAATTTPTPTPTPKVEAVELIVEALDNVEIEYSAPKGKPQKIKLSAEQIHTFKSRSGLKINFSNGGAVNLILNGREIGIPGDLGQPIKLSY